MNFILYIIIFIALVKVNAQERQALINEFEVYKENFNKTYADRSTEAYARFCYVYNKQRINLHNLLFDRGRKTFSLRENQFTDMRFIRFRDIFRETQNLGESFASALPTVPNVPPAEYSFEANGTLSVADQGISCNSGWAQATAKAIEIMQSMPDALSAQNLIDCAGGSRACKTQVPQTAFDFLTQFQQKLHLASDYPQNILATEQGMCIIPNGATTTATLNQYARLKDGDDESLMRYVGAGYPVLVEFNPASFEFMHYGGGVFQKPFSWRGSHVMIVVGYGVDAETGRNYWSLLNSFGSDWGEEGLFKIERIASAPITKNAIFPL